jgi:tRNA pseudouridine55 synthase
MKQTMDGILNIHKPSGKTSFSVVSVVKRLIKERRVGHAGTLDPMASGVLPVCFGKGTRIVEFLLEASKTYYARIELGFSTDTYDAKGSTTRLGDYSNISMEKIEQSLDQFHGIIHQTPPMFSAIKYNGKRLYQFAREGISIKRNSRTVNIYSLELLDYKPPLVTIKIECSRGTYIRTLAHELGELLGCGAHLRNLVRLSYGPFGIESAISLNKLEDAFLNNNWQRFIYPLDTVLNNLPRVIVTCEQEQIIKNGSSVIMKPSQINNGNEERCCAYNYEGCFLAVLYFNTERNQWEPKKVFAH